MMKQNNMFPKEIEQLIQNYVRLKYKLKSKIRIDTHEKIIISNNGTISSHVETKSNLHSFYKYNDIKNEFDLISTCDSYLLLNSGRYLYFRMVQKYALESEHFTICESEIDDDLDKYTHYIENDSLYCVNEDDGYRTIEIKNKHAEWYNIEDNWKYMDKNLYCMYYYDTIRKTIRYKFVLKHEPGNINDYHNIIYSEYEKQWKLCAFGKKYEFAPKIESLYITEQKIYIIDKEYLITYKTPTIINKIFSICDLKIEQKQILKYNDTMCEDIKIISYCNGTLFLKNKTGVYECILGDKLIIEKITMPYEELDVIYMTYDKLIGIQNDEMIVAIRT